MYEKPIIEAAKIIANAIVYLAEQIKNHTYHSTHLHDEKIFPKRRITN